MADESLLGVPHPDDTNRLDETALKPKIPRRSANHAASTPNYSSMSSNFTDSGYSSPEDPISLPQDSAEYIRLPRIERIPIKLGGQNLFRFKPTPENSTKDRVNHVINQIEPLIVARLKKNGGRLGTLTTRSMILGTTEENAHDHIVVFCPSQLLDTIRNFLDKSDIIKELCAPTNHAREISIIVDGRGPRLTANLSYSTISMGRAPRGFDNFWGSNEQTICGSPLKFRNLHRDVRIATVGGMVEVVNKAGQRRLYGMTAGHVFNHDNTTSPDDMPLTDSEGNFSMRLPHYTFGDRETFSLCKVWTKGAPQVEGPDYDWALLESEDLLAFSSNKCKTKWLSGHTADCALSTDIGKFSGDESHHEVLVVANTEASLPGQLSNEPARILFESSDAFTPAYILTLNDGEVSEGDSGTWVVDSYSYNTFGHIVAADIFGDAYVLPLEQTFEDIRRSLDADSIALASPQDFAPNRNHYSLLSGQCLDIGPPARFLSVEDHFESSYKEANLADTPMLDVPPDSTYGSMEPADSTNATSCGLEPKTSLISSLGSMSIDDSSIEPAAIQMRESMGHQLRTCW